MREREGERERERKKVRWGSERHYERWWVRNGNY
jgi:hypothetical protein